MKQSVAAAFGETSFPAILVVSSLYLASIVLTLYDNVYISQTRNAITAVRQI